MDSAPRFVSKEAGAGIFCRITFLYIPGVPVAFIDIIDQYQKEHHQCGSCLENG